jgi:hypothetical protein
MWSKENMNNLEVVKLWSKGRAGRSGNMSTDGKAIWSYAMLIGELVNGERVVYRRSRSVTTSKHINLAARYADKVIAPE